MLSAATVVTAWSAYQATRWSGDQAGNYTEASATRTESVRSSTLANRQILIENPSLYMKLEGHEWPESLFLGELVKRTGCGLLIDVNNVFVSASNLGFNSISYLDALPRGVIGEIHLAGHSEDPLMGRGLLIDSHDSPISGEVWKLYDWLLARCGADRPPTLIERDNDIPAFGVLMAERDKAAAMMAGQRVVVHA